MWRTKFLNMSLVTDDRVWSKISQNFVSCHTFMIHETCSRLYVTDFVTVVRKKHQSADSAETQRSRHERRRKESCVAVWQSRVSPRKSSSTPSVWSLGSVIWAVRKLITSHSHSDRPTHHGFSIITGRFHRNVFNLNPDHNAFSTYVISVCSTKWATSPLLSMLTLKQLRYLQHFLNST